MFMLTTMQPLHTLIGECVGVEKQQDITEHSFARRMSDVSIWICS